MHNHSRMGIFFKARTNLAHIGMMNVPFETKQAFCFCEVKAFFITSIRNLREGVNQSL